MSYNGHKSWDAWNVALWVANDESLYRLACEAMVRAHYRPRLAAQWLRGYLPERTPDGARYSLRSLAAALGGFDRPD